MDAESASVLKELMRHASVTTTEKYYIGIHAQETAKFLREVTPKKNGTQQEAEVPVKINEGAGT